MTIITVRNLDPAVKEKIQARAARHGHSMESEIREILTAAPDHEEEAPSIFSAADAFRAAAAEVGGFTFPDRIVEQQRPVEFP
jgi:plasmid stability protein